MTNVESCWLVVSTTVPLEFHRVERFRLEDRANQRVHLKGKDWCLSLEFICQKKYSEEKRKVPGTCSSRAKTASNRMQWWSDKPDSIQFRQKSQILGSSPEWQICGDFWAPGQAGGHRRPPRWPWRWPRGGPRPPWWSALEEHTHFIVILISTSKLPSLWPIWHGGNLGHRTIPKRPLVYDYWRNCHIEWLEIFNLCVLTILF